MQNYPCWKLFGALLALSPVLSIGATSTQATIPLGVYEGPGANGAAQIPVFAGWFGRQPDRALDFFANDTWPSLESDAAWGCASWWPASGAVVPAMTFSVPLTVNGTPLADVAAGLHDGSFRSVANSLVSNNWGRCVVRLGWEFNGSWMPWSAGNDPAGYVAAYRHVVAVMRSVPGAAFTFDWCTSWGPNATAPDSVYPGDDVVDIIGMDVYNRYYSPADADPTHRWNTYLTASYGLNWLASFSHVHGKPLSIPEWGTGEWLVGDGGIGGGDDGLFVTNMSNFLKSNGAAYSDYWDINASGYDASISNGEHPVAAAALKAEFGTVFSLVIVPVTSPGVSPPGPILWIGVGAAATSTSVSINFSPTYGGGTPNSYAILYRLSGTESWSTYGSVEAVGWQTLSGLSPGTSYDVSVEAVNAAGDGQQSPVLSLSTQSSGPASLSPPGLIPWIGQGDASTLHSVSINFAPPYGGGAPSSYSILYRPTGSGSWITYGSVANVGWQTVGGLNPGTSYDVSVEAVNSDGVGPQSATCTLSTMSLSAASAAAPGMIPWIGQGQASTYNSISINFAPPNNGGTPTGYVIMIRVTGQSSWQTYGTVTWTGWQTISGLSPGTSYDTEVYATNGSGNGIMSAVYSDSTL